MGKRVGVRLWLVVVGVCLWPLSALAAPILTAAGSGVNLGITRLLAEAFMKSQPGTVIQVPGSIGTRGAIKAAAEGVITFGLISRPLKGDELAMGFTVRPYGRVPIVVAVHPGIPEGGITTPELLDIYRGTKTAWRDGRTIIVQAREKSDSGFGVLQDRIPGFRAVYQESLAANRWSVYYTDQEANQAIAKTAQAIGVSDLGMIRTEGLAIKALKLDGVAPSPETLASGPYPLGRDLAFIYREKHLPEAGKAFLDFVRSDRAGRILKAQGYIPLK